MLAFPWRSGSYLLTSNICPVYFIRAWWQLSDATFLDRGPPTQSPLVSPPPLAPERLATSATPVTKAECRPGMANNDGHDFNTGEITTTLPAWPRNKSSGYVRAWGEGVGAAAATAH